MNNNFKSYEIRQYNFEREPSLRTKGPGGKYLGKLRRNNHVTRKRIQRLYDLSKTFSNLERDKWPGFVKQV